MTINYDLLRANATKLHSDLLISYREAFDVERKHINEAAQRIEMAVASISDAEYKISEERASEIVERARSGDITDLESDLIYEAICQRWGIKTD